jgi:hypothetical protein
MYRKDRFLESGYCSGQDAAGSRTAMSAMSMAGKQKPFLQSDSAVETGFLLKCLLLSAF